MKKCCVFARVSTDKQSNDRQISDLSTYAEGKGWKVVHSIQEKISGATENKDREGIQELIGLAQKRKIDVVLVTELSRLGRNAFQVQSLIEEMKGYGVSVAIQTLGIETMENGKESPLVGLMIAVINQFSQMERQFLIDRINSGLNKAREKGIRLGRREGAESQIAFLNRYKSIVPDLPKLSVRQIAKLHDISPATVMKLKKVVAA